MVCSLSPLENENSIRASTSIVLFLTEGSVRRGARHAMGTNTPYLMTERFQFLLLYDSHSHRHLLHLHRWWKNLFTVISRKSILFKLGVRIPRHVEVGNSNKVATRAYSFMKFVFYIPLPSLVQKLIAAACNIRPVQ